MIFEYNQTNGYKKQTKLSELNITTTAIIKLINNSDKCNKFV